MSSSDERNFRSQYYEKVGFRCMEEKRSIDPLLREVPVDGSRLAHFVRLHLVPGMYRPLVWKLLLKVQPCHHESAEFVAARRRETCNDTEHMLRVLGHVTDVTPPPLVYWLGWLLNSGRLVTMDAAEIAREGRAPQLEVARLAEELFDEPVERCWVSWQLWTTAAHTLEALPDQVSWLTAQLEPALAAHVSRLGLLTVDEHGLLRGWIARLFCGILPSSSVERLLDRVAAGAKGILELTAAGLLQVHSRALLTCTDPADALHLLQTQHEDTDRVVSWALDSWLKLNKT